jgi:hypothetical protein
MVLNTHLSVRDPPPRFVHQRRHPHKTPVAHPALHLETLRRAISTRQAPRVLPHHAGRQRPPCTRSAGAARRQHGLPGRGPRSARTQINMAELVRGPSSRPHAFPVRRLTRSLPFSASRTERTVVAATSRS